MRSLSPTPPRAQRQGEGDDQQGGVGRGREHGDDGREQRRHQGVGHPHEHGGERDQGGLLLPWYEADSDDPKYAGSWPTEMQAYGIDWSLGELIKDVNNLLEDNFEPYERNG